ncbi:Argonaute siRNA chaperone complex subunit Arb1-domain-containing protein [Talaromyces proteolyticus]|uniref:Argonaute siRNA chaperone complex subunit Arb1-domain-containing protein n=1 Tax=Talaromyces proteolyticus TaxID=1131652 RepID=A0AAD4L5V4_9EURO|nr:Argonaute siRNA chaperone complex subunit Arb1-domain-containing protein [Talaromyces proteolyticus]KAH8705155.1 Argonaute siRNA chaperone complex subunit Arb1-domain-containing protein [Talaromyces proteolyticus]
MGREEQPDPVTAESAESAEKSTTIAEVPIVEPPPDKPEEKVHTPPVAYRDDKNAEEKPLALAEVKGLTAKQKKKLAMKAKYKNRPKSKAAGQPKPTGFEDYFAEGPITPDDHDYEENIYSLDRPIIFRLQEALNRYQQKRRLLNERMYLFADYLRYGGVDVGAKLYGGVSERELKEMDKEGILVARSQANISFNKIKLKVDFELVVKGFLSSHFPDKVQPNNLETVQMATRTIKNWLNYLVFHKVASEHNNNIISAIYICELAEIQLWDNLRLLSVAPGDFNKACSFLFGGHYFDPEAEKESSADWEQERMKRKNKFMTQEIAHKVMKFALACTSTDEQASLFDRLSKANELHATAVQDIDGFEVTEIFMPEQKVRDFYNKHGPDLNPVGKLCAKACRNPDGVYVDLAPGEKLPNIDELEFEFLVEENLLNYYYTGMKVCTNVWEFNCGVYFYDEVFAAYCTFYTVLWNDLMLEWKEPRDLTKEQKLEGKEEDETEKVDAHAEGL